MHSNITVTFVVENAEGPVHVTVERFLKILDRVMPGDETMTAPRRLGGDGGQVYVDQWYAGDVTDNGGNLVGQHTYDGLFTYADLPDPDPDDVISADEAEAAGVDPGLRDVG
jgi:hypothetical protein